MPIRIKLQTPKLADLLDARLLVARVSDAATKALRSALIDGVSPVDGAPRRENSKGRPEGYRTGRLANGLRRTVIEGTKLRASCLIVPPRDRAGWVASRGDVLVANGSVATAVQAAADEYVSGSEGER